MKVALDSLSLLKPTSLAWNDDGKQKSQLGRDTDELSAESPHRRHVARRAGGAELIEATDLRTLLTDGEQGFSFS